MLQGYPDKMADREQLAYPDLVVKWGFLVKRENLDDPDKMDFLGKVVKPEYLVNEGKMDAQVHVVLLV